MAGPFGGMKDLGKLLKEAQQVGEKMKKVEEELASTEVTGTSGGGMVTATVTGGGQVIGLKISPEVVDPDDIELLEDLVISAISEAMEKSQEIRQEKLGGVMPSAAGMNIPGLPF
ncbi:MAG TPA: YbaB/EbfC family nucleoid-associated protein [Armatimonadota bacterium]|jgi:DNA-binding YbaB/EbfC family protein|nr:YbaB/EbfC family nucleoid-associated protein [Armatimonadota bacterium]